MAAKNPTISADASISTMNTVISAIPDSSLRRETALINCSRTHPVPRPDTSLHIVVHERHAAQAHLRGQRITEILAGGAEHDTRSPAEGDVHLADLVERARKRQALLIRRIAGAVCDVVGDLHVVDIECHGAAAG